MNPQNPSTDSKPEKGDKKDTGEKKLAVNPNPRANENIPENNSSEKTSEAGSEITDGEGG